MTRQMGLRRYIHTVPAMLRDRPISQADQVRCPVLIVRGTRDAIVPARVARRLNAGQTLAASEWTPNAGTRMVKDVMNAVKRRYAWIDLLKPEAEAAARTLLAIDPSQAKAITELFGVIGQKVVGSLEVDGRLSAEGFVPPPPVRKPANGDLLDGRAKTSASDDRWRTASIWRNRDRRNRRYAGANRECPDTGPSARKTRRPDRSPLAPRPARPTRPAPHSGNKADSTPRR